MTSMLTLLCLVGTVHSQTVSDCGAPGDHMSNVKMQVTPDPVPKGTPFTLDISGDLDEDATGGNVVVDLNVKALGIINEPVKATVPFTFTPGLAKGHQTITVGPVDNPSIPGSSTVTGTVKITNAKGEPVSCMKLNIKTGAEEVAKPDAVVARASARAPEPVTDCTKATDHMKNLAFSTDPQGVTHIAGTFDEDLPKLTVLTDVVVKIPLIPLPELKVKTPISMSPGLKKGDIKITVGPVQGELPNALPVTVTGSVKATDGNAEEIFCLNLNVTDQVTIV